MTLTLERRRCSRTNFSNIEIESRTTGQIIGHSRDISPYGIYVESKKLLQPGTKILLEFRLPNDVAALKAYCEIKWMRDSHNLEVAEHSGMGIQFKSMYDADRRKLENYLVESSKRIDSDYYTLADFINLPDADILRKTIPFWEFIEDSKIKGYYTYGKSLLSASQNRVSIFDEITGKEKEIIMMGSSNYLGLQTHPKVLEAANEAIKKYGTGAVGSPLHTGRYDIHKTLEKKLAQMKGCEDAMIFSSGYAANLGCISSLVMKRDLAVIDRLSHASVIDGCAISRGSFRTFRHSDMESLRHVLENNKQLYDGKLVIVDGVYSSEGDVAPLPDIVDIAREYGARVMVDDAHATGVLGNGGGGTLDHFDMKGKVDIVMGTLSKTLGGVGGFIASSKEVINYLRHYARSAFFSASIPPSIAASVLAAIQIMESEPERRLTLWRNINYMKDNLKALGFNISDAQSALIPIIIGEELLLRKISKRIYEEGVYLAVFPYPSVPKGQARLRLSITGTHTIKDLDETLEILERVGKEFGVLGLDNYQGSSSAFAA